MNPIIQLEWSLVPRSSMLSAKWSNCRFGTLQVKKGLGRKSIPSLHSWWHLGHFDPWNLSTISCFYCLCQVCNQELLQRSSGCTVGLWYYKVNLPFKDHIQTVFSKIQSNLCSLFKYRLAVCSRETYNALTTWLSDARMLASQNIVIILCGNKKDLDADREVTFLEASRFAQENGTNWNRIFWYFLGVVLIESIHLVPQDNITILWLHICITSL